MRMRKDRRATAATADGRKAGAAFDLGCQHGIDGEGGSGSHADGVGFDSGGSDGGGSDGSSYSIKGLAELAGVSERALRHFEDLGVLHPRRQGNGYRSYGHDDVLRLQQAMLYRACGVPLRDIATMLDDPGHDAGQALRKHLATLEEQRDQLDVLIATVQKTLAVIEKGDAMSDKERFEGLKKAAIRKNEEQYGAEARARYGDAAVDASNKAVEAMNQEEWNDVNELGAAINKQLAAAMATGDPAGPEAQRLCQMHERWLRAFWGEGMYSREAHMGLAEGYVADPRFTAYYDGAAGEGATKFLRDALAVYCA